MPIYEYVCKNTNCELYNQMQEYLLLSFEEREKQECAECKEPLTRKQSSTSRHISWSTWQV